MPPSLGDTEQDGGTGRDKSDNGFSHISPVADQDIDARGDGVASFLCLLED